MIPRSGSYLLSPAYWEDPGRTFIAGLIDDAVAYTPDVEGDEVVADITAAEVTAPGYARATLGSLAASWDSGNQRWRYQCTSPDFGPVDTGVDVSRWWIAEEVTDDTDSPLLVVATFAAVEATDGDAFIVTVDSEGVVRSKDVTV